MKLLHFINFYEDEKTIIREAFLHIELNYPVGFNILSSSQVALSFVHDGIKCFDNAIEELKNPKKEKVRPRAKLVSPEEKSKKIQEGLALLRQAADMVEDFTAGCLDDVSFN